jgi:MFS superfamily sulfate permease-like transporter
LSKDLSEYRIKYDLYRHHAWAGLGLLSIFIAIRYIIPSIPIWIFVPVLLALIVYILIALMLTYKYRAGLRAKIESSTTSIPSEEAKLQKLKYKLEKKKQKAQVKLQKKKRT